MIDVEAGLLVAGTQSPVELVVQFVVVAEVQPAELRPAAGAKGARLVFDQLYHKGEEMGE